MKESKRSHPFSRRCLRGAIVGGILVVWFLCAQAAAWQVVGFVLEKHGTWRLKDGPDLTEGARLNAGGLLINLKPAEGDHIAVVNLNGDLILRIRCNSQKCNACSGKSDACYDPIPALPQPKQSVSVFGTVLESVMELVKGRPERYSVHRVRGHALSDAVLRLDQGRVDIGPVFAGQESGRHRIQFVSLADRRWKSDPFSFDWDPARGNATAVPGLDRGLYALVLFDGNSGDSSPLMEAWVLLANPDEYPKAASAFKAASEQAAKWGENVSRDTTQRFLRANLDYLASHPVEGSLRDGKR